MKIEGKLYIGDNIEISVHNKIIDNIKVYIPLHWKTEDILKIYDTLTGYKPNIEDKGIEDITEIDLDPLYSYSILDGLKDYYPYVKKIRENGFSWYSIYAINTDLKCENNTIIITVDYTDSHLNAPGASERYSGMISDRAKISGITLQNKINKYLKNGMKLAQGTINEIYGDPVYLKEFYGKYVETRPSTENDSKEKATIKDNKKETNSMKIEGTIYFGSNTEISVQNKIIDNIKLYIPSYWKTEDILKIYDTITGYMPNDTDKDIEKITDNDLVPLYTYPMLTELEKYYPCIKNINKTELKWRRIYVINTDLYCENDTITITVNYTDQYNKAPNASVAYRCMCSDRDEIFNIVLRERIKNSTYGAQIDEYCKRDAETVNEALSKMYAERYLKELKEKYQGTESSTKNDVKVIKETINSVFGLPTFEAFDAITDELKDTYIKKNHDYGNSFDKSIDKFGLTAAVVRMSDKMERLSSLLNKDAKVDESIRDTVMDLANYCIMTAMYLDKKEKNK